MDRTAGDTAVSSSFQSLAALVIPSCDDDRVEDRKTQLLEGQGTGQVGWEKVFTER